MDISKQTVLITGAAQGLGLAITKAFEKKNANLILVDKNSESLEKINNVKHRKFVINLSIKEEVYALINDLKNKSIYINTLIHNASILVPTSFEMLTEQMWSETINVTLETGFLLSKLVWNDMVSKRDGVIIFVSSGSGIEGFVDESAYCAAKHGLEGLMKSLALEGKDYGVQVFTVTPGMYMNTPMSQANYTEEFKKKWIDPIQLTPAFLKLASRKYKSLNGQRINAWELSNST